MKKLLIFGTGEIATLAKYYFETDSDYKVEGEIFEVIKRQMISVLPKVCIFHLNRFELNYVTFTREKINSRFEFPKRLDLSPYTTNSQKKEWYRLHGVVVHSGTANYGHYYSYIEVNKEWLEFNDATVRPFDFGRLESECFGGKELKTKFNVK